MKAFSKSVGLGLILFTLLSFAKKDSWIHFESEEFQFEIDFPQKPKAQPQEVETAAGTLKMNMFIYDASEAKSDQNLVYMVNYTAFPKEMLSVDTETGVEEFFRGSIDGAVRNVHGKLLSETIISLGDYPGREVRIDFKEGLAVITMRTYLVENQMYMLQTITATEQDFNTSIGKFMDSFKILK